MNVANHADPVLIGLPGSGSEQQARALGIDHADPERVADPQWRSRARSERTVVWVDRPDAELAAASGLGVDEIHRLRQRYLGSLTTMADAIVVPAGDTAGGSVGDGSVEEPDRAVVAALAGAVPSRSVQPIVEVMQFADGRQCPIVVGRGVVAGVEQYLPARSGRVAVITQDGIDLDLPIEREHRVFSVETGERAKRLEVVGDLASRFARWGLTRADVVVSVGGGVVSDLAGFVAATYHRGIPVVHVSTTLLGQIDAAIGGKCGVNLAEGKNLVGAFWQPDAVLCEIDALDTLPRREFISGMGELAKYHFLGGGRLDRLPLTERVAAAALIKAEVVTGDEREGGRRAILNYGHTLAHALEAASTYDMLRHGEAVAIGVVYAAELARRLGRIDDDAVAEHRRVVSAYGLDAVVDPSFDHDELIDLFSRDKKAVDGITFVLDGPDGVEPLLVDDRAVMLDALAAMTP